MTPTKSQWSGTGRHGVVSSPRPTHAATPTVELHEKHVRRIAGQGLAVDLYRCTGPEEHRWVEPMEGLEQ